MKDIVVFTQLLVIGLIPLATSFILYIFNLTLADKTLDTFNSYITVASIFYIILLPIIVVAGFVYIAGVFKSSGVDHPYMLILMGLMMFTTTFIPAYYYFSMRERELNQNITFSNVFISYPIHGIALIPYIYSSYVITNKLRRTK